MDQHHARAHLLSGQRLGRNRSRVWSRRLRGSELHVYVGRGRHHHSGCDDNFIRARRVRSAHLGVKSMVFRARLGEQFILRRTENVDTPVVYTSNANGRHVADAFGHHVVPIRLCWRASGCSRVHFERSTHSDAMLLRSIDRPDVVHHERRVRDTSSAIPRIRHHFFEQHVRGSPFEHQLEILERTARRRCTRDF